MYDFTRSTFRFKIERQLLQKWNIKLQISDLGFLLCSLRCHEQRLMCESGMNAFNSIAADEHLACGCYGDLMIFKKLQKVVISTPMWENVKILFPLRKKKNTDWNMKQHQWRPAWNEWNVLVNQLLCARRGNQVREQQFKAVAGESFGLDLTCTAVWS